VVEKWNKIVSQIEGEKGRFFTLDSFESFIFFSFFYPPLFLGEEKKQTRGGIWGGWGLKTKK